MTGEQNHYPSRYSNRSRVRHLFGDMADRYAGFYDRSDPAADELAAWLEARGGPAKRVLEQALRFNGKPTPSDARALRAFIEELEEIPAWVDFEQINVGALAYQRFGVVGMLILSAWSLINGYYSSAAVKPLALTGQLHHNTQRRLAETARFVSEVTQVNGLRRGGRGFAIVARVRLIHAYVRRACLSSEEWRSNDWGVPINQADMFGTLLEFSHLVMEGVQRLGFSVPKEEREAILALWRYCGHLNGVDPWLLEQLASERKTQRVAQLVRMVQPGPDEDSLSLTEALLKVPGQNAKGSDPQVLGTLVTRFHHGLARALNGTKIADDLGLPDDWWQHSVHPFRAMIVSLEALRQRIPGATSWASRLGNEAIRRDLNRLLRQIEPDFQPKS